MASEENVKELSDMVFWRNLIVRYWYLVVVFGLLMIGAAIGFILTFDWYIKTSAIGGFGSWTFDQFSLATAIIWCLMLCLWTLLFVVLPTLAVVGILIAITWYAILPLDLKEELKIRTHTPKPGKRSGGGGAFGFFLFLGLCIFIFIDGNWFTPFGSLSIGYFAYAWLTVFIWVAIIFCIPIVIIGLIWFVRKYRKVD